MVNLPLLAATLSVASLAAAHSGVRADGGHEHMKMLRRSNANGLASGNKLHKRCSGHSTHRSRKNYKSRASTSASATSNGDSANTTKAVQVKAAVKKGESSDKTSSSAKVFSTQAPKTTTTTSANSESTSSSSSSAAGNYDGGDTSGKGLFGVSDSTCGDSGASETPTNDGGPNGKQSWLNCGVSGGGWTPPSVKLSQLKTLSLDAAVAMDNSVFSACEPYLSHFDKIGAQYNIPPILLASIAMQESSCDPSVKGDNGGAFGLMQITEDKCGNAPNGDCNDVDYNIATGAKYFADTLAANDENVLVSLAGYNGWYTGLTTSAAMQIRTTCWDCQQNLDYLQQMLNGWLLGLPGWELGNVRNLQQ